MYVQTQSCYFLHVFKCPKYDLLLLSCLTYTTFVAKKVCLWTFKKYIKNILSTCFTTVYFIFFLKKYKGNKYSNKECNKQE